MKSTLILKYGGRLLVLATLICSSCKPAPKPAVVPEPARVRIATVVSDSISIPVRSSGFVATGEEVRLSFKTGGIIARTYVREGDAVRKGQLLAILNLEEINAQVKQAGTAVSKAQRDYDRAKNLYADSVATLEQLQNAESALNMARAVSDAATYNLARSRITAPGPGIILKQLARESELVAPGYPVFALGLSSKNWVVRTSLSDRDVVKIQIGDSALIRIDAWPDQLFRGAVDQIDEAANPQTGTYETELRLEPVQVRLATGFVAGVEILPSRKAACFLIPVEALTEAEGREGSVFVIEDGDRVRKTTVRIIALTGDSAAVSGELEAGRKVVTEGAAYLADQARVAIIQ